MIKLMFIGLFSQFSTAKMLSPQVEGKILAFDTKTVAIYSTLYKIEIPRKVLDKKPLNIGDFIQVTLSDGKLSEVSKAISVSYRFITK